MAIDSVNSNEGQMSIEARNIDSSIHLGKGRVINLVADYYIKTADQEDVSQNDPLRFFIFKAVTVEDNGSFITPQNQIMDQNQSMPIKENAAEKKTPGFLAPLAGVCLLIASRGVRQKK